MLNLTIGSLSAIIVCLLILSAFFSATEIALFSFRKTRLNLLVKQGNKKALLVNKIMQYPDVVLSTILVGNNITNTASSVLATVLAIELLGEGRGALVALVAMAFLTIQFAEIIPKVLASQFWEKMAFAASRPIRIFGFIFSPFVFFFSLTTRALAFIFRIKIQYRQPLITREELRHTVELAKESGHLKEDENLILQNVFRFSDKLASEVMLPRNKVDLINLNAPSSEILDIITKTHHTRIPVYQGTPDNIIGVLYTKEYLNVVCYGEAGLIVLHDLLRPAFIVYDNQKTGDVFRQLQKKRIHLAVVKNKDNKFVGIITLEDIMEEIFGEIMDEHD